MLTQHRSVSNSWICFWYMFCDTWQFKFPMVVEKISNLNSSIWQHFSCLLDEGIPKIWKKLNSHGGFLRAEPRQGKNVLPDGLNWLCYFVGSSKSHRENSISCIFLESPHQVDMKSIVKCWKEFLWYFATLKTYCEMSFFLYVPMWCSCDSRTHSCKKGLDLNFSSNSSIATRRVVCI